MTGLEPIQPEVRTMDEALAEIARLRAVAKMATDEGDRLRSRPKTFEDDLLAQLSEAKALLQRWQLALTRPKVLFPVKDTSDYLAGRGGLSDPVSADVRIRILNDNQGAFEGRLRALEERVHQLWHNQRA